MIGIKRSRNHDHPYRTLPYHIILYILTYQEWYHGYEYTYQEKPELDFYGYFECDPERMIHKIFGINIHYDLTCKRSIPFAKAHYVKVILIDESDFLDDLPFLLELGKHVRKVELECFYDDVEWFCNIVKNNKWPKNTLFTCEYSLKETGGSVLTNDMMNRLASLDNVGQIKLTMKYDDNNLPYSEHQIVSLLKQAKHENGKLWNKLVFKDVTVYHCTESVEFWQFIGAHFKKLDIFVGIEQSQRNIHYIVHTVLANFKEQLKKIKIAVSVANLLASAAYLDACAKHLPETISIYKCYDEQMGARSVSLQLDTIVPLLSNTRVKRLVLNSFTIHEKDLCQYQKAIDNIVQNRTGNPLRLKLSSCGLKKENEKRYMLDRSCMLIEDFVTFLKGNHRPFRT